MPLEYGRIAYDAYFKFSGEKSLISGASLPTFDAQKQEIKDAWEAAARAAVNEFIDQKDQKDW